MLASRPGLGLKAIQDHLLEILVLRYMVLVLNGGGLGQEPRPPTIQDHGWIMAYWYYGNGDDCVSRGYCQLSTLRECTTSL